MARKRKNYNEKAPYLVKKARTTKDVDSHFIFSNNPQIKLSNKTNPFQNKISYFQIVFPFFAK